MPKMMSNGAQSAPHKAKDMKKSLGRLFKYLKGFFPLIIVSMILIIANTIFRIVGPNRLAKLTTILEKGVPQIENGMIVSMGIPFELSDIWSIAILLICLYVFGAVFSYIANILIARVCFKTSQKLRSDISRKIDRLPLKKLDRTPYGDILSTVINDVDMIGQTLHTSVSSLVGAIVLFFGSLIMMFVTNWIMAIAAVIIILIILKKKREEKE